MQRVLLLILSTSFLSLPFSSLSQATYPASGSRVEFLGESRPLQELAPLVVQEKKDKSRQAFPKEIPNFTANIPMPLPFADVALPQKGDPLWQEGFMRSGSNVVEPSILVEGIGQNTVGILPPDPVGDASPDHYIQMSNSSGGAYFRVYDKQGEIVFSLPSLSSFWAQFNANPAGDPIVLWDQAARRWLVTEFEDLFSGNSSLLVAVSKSSDPMGEWFAYRFQTPEFPDYPKYAVWNNAYIVTTNEIGPNIPVYALEREAMLNGETEVQLQRFGIPKFNDDNTFQVATPIDFDGNNPPPAGSPGYVVRLYDDAWDGGQDKVELWEIHIDWLDSGNSFLSGPTEIMGAPFDSKLCTNNFTSCIEQPNGVRLDALETIILHRAPYLNFGSHESILLQFAVDVDGSNRAGLRWMELRKANDNEWSLFQEGTYAPNDGLSRFASAIAMDYSGNILMAYSTAGPTQAPSLRFTGRNADDPPGIMTITEYEFARGLSSQSNSRWGDYASMSIDPANGKDFWFTGEYMKPGGQWGSKVMMAFIRQDTIDVGPLELVQPQNSGFLTDQESVQVAVFNFGLEPQSDITISYSVNGGAIVSEAIADTLLPKEQTLHTFTPTVDMTGIGAYNFMIFTELPGDTAFFNDTLRTTVFQLPRIDAAITSFSGLDKTVCDTFTTAGIALANAGVDTLFSALIAYQLNMQEPDTLEWTGVLLPGERELAIIELGPLQEGANTLASSVFLPNGITDEEPDNNNKEINIQTALGGSEIIIQLTTDNFPEETSWELKDEEGNLLGNGGPYQLSNTLIQDQFCLPDACYTFTLFDSFGDGLTGAIPGSLEIKNDEGLILARLNDIDFGDQAVITFCSNAECALTVDASTDNESAPGAEDGRIILRVENGLSPFRFSIDNGDSFQLSPVFSNLEGGSYVVLARDANGCEATLMVMVGTCTLEVSAEVNGASSEGLADGIVTLITSGGEGPFSFSPDGLNFQDSGVFTGLAPGDYTFLVEDAGNGCQLLIDVEVGVLTDTDEPSFSGKQVRLYPNPTEGYFRVEIVGVNDQAFVPVMVFDSQGKVVRRQRLVTYGELTKGVLSLYGLPAGMYFLRFEHAELGRLYKVEKVE